LTLAHQDDGLQGPKPHRHHARQPDGYFGQPALADLRDHWTLTLEQQYQKKTGSSPDSAADGLIGAIVEYLVDSCLDKVSTTADLRLWATILDGAATRTDS
jgi:hypothetical protein